MGSATPLNVTTAKPLIKDLVKALERNTAAILALAAVVAKGAHGTPVLNTDEAARDHVKRLLRQFEEP